MVDNTENFVYSHWKTLTASIGVADKVRQNWWSIIVRRYSEEWRFYHTLSHLQNLLQLFDQWRERIADLENVALAIFFHDIVYDPTSNENEELSIVLFKKFALDALMTPATMARVSNMIRATISHSTDGVPDDLDVSLFLDFDLAILGQDSEVYRDYTRKIRQEYSHYDEKSYRNGRTKILQSLLNSPSLYSSEELRQEYEEQARKNIMEEIAMLQLKCL